MGELNLIIVWLVVCGYNTGVTVSIMLSKTGWPAAKRLQVQSKQESILFFLPLSITVNWNQPSVKKSKPLSRSFIYVKTVLPNCCDKVCTVTTATAPPPPFYKHIHMWELTSHDVCSNLNSLSALAASAWSRNCSSRAAWGQEPIEQEGELLIGLNGCNQSQ